MLPIIMLSNLLRKENRSKSDKLQVIRNRSKIQNTNRETDAPGPRFVILNQLEDSRTIIDIYSLEEKLQSMPYLSQSSNSRFHAMRKGKLMGQKKESNFHQKGCNFS